MSMSALIRVRHLLIFLLLASASVRSLSCDSQPDLPPVVDPVSAVNQYMGADSDDDDISPSRLPGVLRGVSAILDPRVASARSNDTISLGLRN